MWSLLSRRAQLFVVVGATLLFYPAVSWLWEVVAGSLPSTWQTISFEVLLITGLAIACETVWRFLWLLLPALSNTLFPDLNGVWEGRFISNYPDPATGQPTTGWAKIRINQGFFRTSVLLETEKATSHSLRCWLNTSPPDRQYSVCYTYAHGPREEFRLRNPAHSGYCELKVDRNDDPNRARGTYYTNRGTAGTIEVVRNPAAQRRSWRDVFGSATGDLDLSPMPQEGATVAVPKPENSDPSSPR